ncbi:MULTISPECIES: phosphatase PAP2 family protein [unclassified Bacillus (in: firmicutes)]|uniref:phosphatase PAP2 family protein n=1 Tax=unclassified Bacillus (in: firmicutes) TaxID=185979 RepID=UPI0008E80A31|nr:MULTISPECIES: phosphatase PAP2 family protein [unclassified Bacillus (in: firmicutes)]SFA91773.1 undecaprenyl-diphosphatase [Bacillus sp. UNCCL13]SFQ85659.1 undecaprenyl-diphosphatase [Bacillus sp. cl95]
MMKNVTKKNLLHIGSVLLILSFFIKGFIEISEELKENELVSFDRTVIQFVQNFISDRLTEVMIFITFLGSIKWITFGVIVGTLILWILKKYSLSIFLAVSSTLGAVFNILLKNIFQRERPDIQPLISEVGFSFPSGHSMGSFIFYGALAFVIVHFAKKNLWKYFGVFVMVAIIALIGISRVYLGVHFPSDIIAGFSAGGAWLTVCFIGYHYYEFRKNIKS